MYINHLIRGSGSFSFGVSGEPLLKNSKSLLRILPGPAVDSTWVSNLVLPPLFLFKVYFSENPLFTGNLTIIYSEVIFCHLLLSRIKSSIYGQAPKEWALFMSLSSLSMNLDFDEFILRYFRRYWIMTDAQRSQISGASERFLGKYILRITLLLRALRAITFSRKFLYLKTLFSLGGFEILLVKNLKI